MGKNNYKYQWNAGSTAFVELAYALFESKALQTYTNEQPDSKNQFIHHLADTLNVQLNSNHSTIHHHCLYKDRQNNFPYHLYKIYSNYIDFLLESKDVQQSDAERQISKMQYLSPEIIKSENLELICEFYYRKMLKICNILDKMIIRMRIRR